MAVKIAQLMQTKMRNGLWVQFLLHSAQLRSTGSSSNVWVTHCDPTVSPKLHLKVMGSHIVYIMLSEIKLLMTIIPIELFKSSHMADYHVEASPVMSC